MSEIRSVLLCDDDGAAAFGKAAPLLVEALELIKSVRTNAAAVSLGHHLIHTAACASPSLSSRRSVYTHNTMAEELNQQRLQFQHYFAEIIASFSRLSASGTAPVSTQKVEHVHGVTFRTTSLFAARSSVNDLLVPHGVLLGDVLGTQAFVDYELFRAKFNRLGEIVSDGRLFTACEPRLRVLQSRYALYRAYNGAVEDKESLSVVGGSIEGTPKKDIRQLETCMCVDTLIEFIRHIHRTEPHFPLRRTPTRSYTKHADTPLPSACESADTAIASPLRMDARVGGDERSSAAERTAADHANAATPPRASTTKESALCHGDDARHGQTSTDHTEDSVIAQVVQLQDDPTETVSDAMRRFVGAQAARSCTYYSGNYTSRPWILSAESLALRPNYTSDAEQKLDLDELADYDRWSRCHTTANTLLCHGSHACSSSSSSFRPPCPPSADTDHAASFLMDEESRTTSRRPRASELLHHFLTIHNGNEGELLGRLVVPVIAKQTKAASPDSLNRLELELTVSGACAGELQRWARWCERCDLLGQCPSVQLCICVTQEAYRRYACRRGAPPSGEAAAVPGSGGCARDGATCRRSRHALQEESKSLCRSTDGCAEEKEGTTAAAAGVHARQDYRAAAAEDLDGVMQHIFAPVWHAVLHPTDEPALTRMLRHVTTFAVRFTHSAERQELPSALDHAHCDCLRYPVTGPAPPDAFFAYHLWRNVQLLNAMTCAHAYDFHVTQGGGGVGAPGMFNEQDCNSNNNNSNSKRNNRAGKKKDERVNSTWAREEASRRADPLFPRAAGAGRCGSGAHDKAESVHVPRPRSMACDDSVRAEGHTAAPSSRRMSCSVASPACRTRTSPPLFDQVGALRFRIHGGSRGRGSFLESVMGLLLPDEMVNPSHVFQWSPLHYLYYLTQRTIILTPSRNSVTSMTLRPVLHRAVRTAMQTGLHLSLASHDALFYHTSDDAMREELATTMKDHQLSASDVAELCLHSMEAGAVLTPSERRGLFGCAWPRALSNYNMVAVSHVSSHRLQHREIALQHEMRLVCRHGATSTSTSSGSTSPLACSVPELDACATPRAQQLCRFYHIPTTTVSDATLYDSCYYEKSMRFARIRIAGPRMRIPSELAKQLALAMVRRQRYQQCNACASGGGGTTNEDKEKGGCPPEPPAQRRPDSHERYETAAQVMHALTPACAPRSPVAKAFKAEAEVTPLRYRCRNGVFDAADEASCAVHRTAAHGPPRLPSWLEYQEDVHHLRRLTHQRELKRFAARRLGMLECKYNLHVALTNEDEEDYGVYVGEQAMNAAAQETENRCSAPPALYLSGSPPRCDGSMRQGGYRRRGGFRKSDLYSCAKVDVHCHMAGGMTARALLSFMKHKLERCGGDVVERDAVTQRPITLRAKFEQLWQQRQRRDELGMEAEAGRGGCAPGTAARPPPPSSSPSSPVLDANSTCDYLYKDMTTGTLQVRAGRHTFNRFDEFNSRYSPMGVAALRSLFLKTDNFMGGRYFAELIRDTFEQQAKEGNTYSEYRLSIYGRHPQEWDQLARWFVIHGMCHATNRWMVQIPRLFALYRRSGMLNSFQQMLDNIFAPIWDASMYPERHPFLNYFLHHVSGFDSVDNESGRESDEAIYLTPSDWTRATNPPYAYYVYYMWANIVTLNRYRASRGLSTFDFRPHGGESGDPDHMADIFLLADGVGHGINLARRPVLQYLYYLAQIPLAVVPLSNNALFCKYADNPLPLFLRRGLNVALGTDSSLMFHHTEQPLIEEYCTAQNFWNLSDTDMYELARNSVLMSGFPHARKEAWLGPLFQLSSVASNDVDKSNVPMTRCAFRYEVYFEEINYLQARSTVYIVNRAMQSSEEEDLHILDTLGITRQEALRHRWSGKPLPPAVKRTTPATEVRPEAPRTVQVAVSNL